MNLLNVVAFIGWPWLLVVAALPIEAFNDHAVRRDRKKGRHS